MRKTRTAFRIPSYYNHPQRSRDSAKKRFGATCEKQVSTVLMRGFSKPFVRESINQRLYVMRVTLDSKITNKFVALILELTLFYTCRQVIHGKETIYILSPETLL